MTDKIWPKPGERWINRHNQNILIGDVVKNKICYFAIKKTEYLSEEQSKAEIYANIEWFLNEYKKSNHTPSDGITHEINVGPTSMHVTFEPKSTRLSRLVVKIENPDFQVYEMDINGKNIAEPLRYLAYLDPAEVKKMMLGTTNDLPDLPATAAHITDIAKATRSNTHDFTAHDVKILRLTAYRALQEFNGNHQEACNELFEDLRDSGFHNPEYMLETRENPKTTEFMENVWDSIQSHLKEEIKAGRFSPFKSDRNDTNPVEPC